MKKNLFILAFAFLGFVAMASDESFELDETIAESSGKYKCVLTDDCKKEHIGFGTCPNTARADAEAVCLLNSESKKSCKRENAVCE